MKSLIKYEFKYEYTMYWNVCNSYSYPSLHGPYDYCETVMGICSNEMKQHLFKTRDNNCYYQCTILDRVAFHLVKGNRFLFNGCY